MLTRERPTEQAEPRVAGPVRTRRRWPFIAGAAVLALVLLAVFAVQQFRSAFRNPLEPQTIDRSQPAVLRALEDLSEYRAASGQFQVVIDVERSMRYVPTFLKGERTLFVAGGSVDGTVDFGRIGSDAVRVSEDRRSVTVTLPHATLSKPRVEPARSYVYDRERGLIDRVGSMFEDSPTSERELYLLAEKKLAAAAAEGDIAERAEANTSRMLRSLLRSLGFTEVTVHFD